MRWLREEVPDEGQIRTWDRRRDISGCVAQADGEDLGSRWCGQETGAER